VLWLLTATFGDAPTAILGAVGLVLGVLLMARGRRGGDGAVVAQTARRTQVLVRKPLSPDGDEPAVEDAPAEPVAPQPYVPPTRSYAPPTPYIAPAEPIVLTPPEVAPEPVPAPEPPVPAEPEPQDRSAPEPPPVPGTPPPAPFPQQPPTTFRQGHIRMGGVHRGKRDD
jgi:hypothetical protein